MIAAHDRFESLAGAVMLGEATAAERAEFDEHAHGCATCREDAFGASNVVTAIAESREAETWRPTVPVIDRIRERSSRRVRWQLGAFGWAVGVSLVLNLALAGGFGTGLGARFGDQPERDTVVATRLTEDPPHARNVAEVTSPSRAAAIVKVLPKRHRAHKHVVAPAAKPADTLDPAKLPVAAMPHDDIPDVLAGLDLDGSEHGKRAVAVAPSTRCEREMRRDERPCPAASP